MNNIAVLFARSDSIYKSIDGLDVYDIKRDARSFNGSQPVIAHPPCRAWGRLSHFANPRPDEKDLAHFAIDKVRKNGGVLEHPEYSKLWAAGQLPFPGETDKFGGWTLPLPQYWFGHLARKNTWLYIVGINPANLPPIPFILGEAEFVVSTSKRKYAKCKPEIPRKHREATPVNFANWLIQVCILIDENRFKNAA